MINHRKYCKYIRKIDMIFGMYIYIYIYIDTDTTIGWLAKKYNRWGTFLFLIIFSQNLYN